MSTKTLKIYAALAIALLVMAGESLYSLPQVSAKTGPRTFHASLPPEVWQNFTLGPADSGSVYLVDVNPLHKNLDGANIQSEIKPIFDGARWNDVLRVRLGGPFKKQQVQITVYRLRGLEARLDVSDSLSPGVWQGYVIAAAADTPYAYLADIDPQGRSQRGAGFERIYIHPEATWEARFWDVLRVQAAPSLSNPLNARLRVYLAPRLALVSEFDVLLRRTDLWAGFSIGPSALKRAYVVRAISTGSALQPSDLNQYILQQEYNGQTWNDVLRLQAGNQDADWEQAEYNFKVYACDPQSCPE